MAKAKESLKSLLPLRIIDFHCEIWPFRHVRALAAVLQVIADIVAKNDGIERCLEDEFVCLIEHNPKVKTTCFSCALWNLNHYSI